MKQQFDAVSFELIEASAFDFNELKNEEKKMLRLQMQKRYGKSTMMSVLESLYGKKQSTQHAYYSVDDICILEPCSDNPEHSQLKSIEEVMTDLNLADYKCLIIPVTQEQAIISAGIGGFLMNLPLLQYLNPPRNHWVTLHYDLPSGIASLIDARPAYVSTWYNYEPLKLAIKKALAAKGLFLLGFDLKYQGVQMDDTHCGAWTVANIDKLVTGSSLMALTHQRPIDDIIAEQLERVFLESTEEDDLGDGTWRDVDEAEIELETKKSSHHIHLDNFIVNLQKFAREELAKNELSDYQKPLQDFIEVIKAANMHLSRSYAVDEQHQRLAALIQDCGHGLQILDNKFQHRRDIFSSIKTFFLALIGILIAIFFSILTVGIGSYYVLNHQEQREKYLDTFFRPEPKILTDVKDKWQTMKVKETLLGELGLLKPTV